MIDEAARAQLVRNAVAGRGLWVGLYAPKSLQQSVHPVVGHLAQDPHLTLVHLGKKNDENRVDRLVDALNAMIERKEVLVEGWRGEITGVGWFWRTGYPTCVALVNSKPIGDLRAALVASLGDLVETFFGFIPHMTMTSNDVFEMTRSCMDGPALRMTFPAMHVVCGEARIPVQ